MAKISQEHRAFKNIVWQISASGVKNSSSPQYQQLSWVRNNYFKLLFFILSWPFICPGYDLIEWLMDRLCIEDSRKGLFTYHVHISCSLITYHISCSHIMSATVYNSWARPTHTMEIFEQYWNLLRNSASSFHWLSSSIFTVRSFVRSSRIGNTSSHLYYMMF